MNTIEAPPSFPMSDAPVEPGKEFGPCLLRITCAYDLWVIGVWDGEVWHDTDGFVATPTHWAPLPEAP